MNEYYLSLKLEGTGWLDTIQIAGLLPRGKGTGDQLTKFVLQSIKHNLSEARLFFKAHVSFLA